jgi:HEAT repeat protein
MGCAGMIHFRFCLATLLLGSACSHVSCSLVHGQERKNADTANPQAIDSQEDRPELLPWIDTFAKGITQAQKSRRPIFVVFSGRSCRFCRELEKEMAKADVQTELARWTLVSLDVDAAPEDARTLAVGPIPALRVLTPAGKTIASHDGLLSAEELVTWLAEQFDSAAGGLNPELIAGESLTALGAIKLVKEFRRRDPAVREAAIRQLLPHPQMAAGPVSSAFAEGSLGARLAAKELLEAWKAPLEGLDPWRPETMTEERLKAIAEWAATLDDNAAADLAKHKELTAEELSACAESISRLLKASPADAAAIREQLARYGAALLPLVYESLKSAEADEARERLTGLRYRLAAKDRLVLEWPGGIERLAAANSATRRQAMDELGSRAGPEEEALLLELFSDPEPLLRELALGALYRINGENADSALIRLLQDPDPNVRAAVLKQLAESSPRGVIPKIAKYVEQEMDPDLIVQAIRVLREAPVQASTNCLTSLLAHESWRIRAEAAEALGKVMENQNGGDTEGRADMYVALIELLKDEDAFVVSRAVTVLGKAQLVTAVDPLAEVAIRHPQLAVTVVTALAENKANSERVEKHLRAFSQSTDAQVRGAAITGLCELNAAELEVELKKALEDPDSSVRIAAAEGVFALLNVEASTGSFYDPSPPPLKPAVGEEEEKAQTEPDEEKPAQPAKSDDTKLDDKELQDRKEGDPFGDDPPSEETVSDTNPEEVVVRRRKHFPKWLPQIEPLLQKLMLAPSADERLAGAMPLIVAGRFDDALPVISKVHQESPALSSKIAGVLYWLPWEKRLTLFDELRAQVNSGDELSVVANGFVRRRDMRAAAPLWSLLAAPTMNGKHADYLLNSLKLLYLGNSWYSPEQATRAERNRLQVDAISHAKEGARWQRLTAYSLLLLLGKEPSLEIAREMKSKADATKTDQLDALRILLLASDHEDAGNEANDALASDRADFRSIALAYFSFGPEAVSSMKEEAFELSSPYSSSGSSKPTIPDDLTPEVLLPLLSNQDPGEVAQAGYLLCLRERIEGLSPLVDYWRVHQHSDARWRKLVYTAAAALGDDQVPLLEEIYAGFGVTRNADYSEVAEFYWTIRSLKSSAALALRKKIREDVGMENLRTYESRF